MLRITSLALLLAGCPTPPSDGVGAGGDPGGTVGGGGGGGGGTVGEDGVAAPVPSEVNGEAKAGAFVITELPAEMKNRPADGDQPNSEEAQAKIRAGDHVTMEGQILCADCKGQLVVNVAPFVEPSDAAPSGPDGAPTAAPGSEGVEFAPVVVKSAGAFQIAVPKHAGKVVLEVIDDVDGNGLPSPGERLAVLHEQGRLVANKNHSGLKVDFGQSLPAPMSNTAPPPAGDGATPPPGGPPQ